MTITNSVLRALIAIYSLTYPTYNIKQYGYLHHYYDLMLLSFNLRITFISLKLLRYTTQKQNIWTEFLMFPFNFVFLEFKVSRAETPPTVKRFSGVICFSPVFPQNTIHATSAAWSRFFFIFRRKFEPL